MKLKLIEIKNEKWKLKLNQIIDIIYVNSRMLKKFKNVWSYNYIMDIKNLAD